MKIESAWSDALSQYNSTYKLLIERLEEKLAHSNTEKISKKEMSTQTGKIIIFCSRREDFCFIIDVCVYHVYIP